MKVISHHPPRQASPPRRPYPEGSRAVCAGVPQTPVPHLLQAGRWSESKIRNRHLMSRLYYREWEFPFRLMLCHCRSSAAPQEERRGPARRRDSSRFRRHPVSLPSQLFYLPHSLSQHSYMHPWIPTPINKDRHHSQIGSGLQAASGPSWRPRSQPPGPRARQAAITCPGRSPHRC